MSIIKVLSEDVRNKIAAGEVIERPASVVKELVENSIDAGAKTITIALEAGGRDLIQVSDDGHGLSYDDALLAFERHATSKIRNVEDIIHIDSLGFRGEALPSIASVSNMSFITRQAEEETATRVEFSHGRLRNIDRTASNVGTNITVKGLFKALPARRKFLRSAQTELRHILKYFHYQAILWPQISFKLISEGRTLHTYIATEQLETRMAEVFGSAFLEDDDLITVSNSVSGYEVSGYIFGLKERRDRLIDIQYTFVNGKYISDKTLRHAIRSAYEPFILKTRAWAKGSTPPYLLFITVPPEQIDMNVHPAKLEVRFREQQRLHGLVHSTLTDALTRYEDGIFASAREKFHQAAAVSEASALEQSIYKSRVEVPRYSEYKKEFEQLWQDDLFKPPPQKAASEEEPSQPEADAAPIPATETREPGISVLLKSEEDYINPWQLHNTYVFVQVEDGLVIIDQHAAHERIIYERLLQRIHGAPPTRQKLIVPLVVDIPSYITAEVKRLIEENMEMLEKTGFVVKKFSGSSLVIEEIPAELSDWQGGKVFLEILQHLESEIEENPDFRISLAKSIACKAAVKAGKPLTRREMVNLINDLFACQTPYFCPHGRPLIIKMSMQDFDKKFKRIL
ncbi:MAG: DNA mismatch repair endonuclease MutL [Candidatus Cloacimonetes bacterium]|nr:DNA mismatch repair endonuclease MutL [Candidatus Cloacimonadota bacterium]NLO10831.1 DNA mismatch repair endonuclease MutL [Candidatus Cloacimonadota bacterium]